MNQCSQPYWSKLNTAAMLHDVFSVTKTHYVLFVTFNHKEVRTGWGVDDLNFGAAE